MKPLSGYIFITADPEKKDFGFNPNSLAFTLYLGDLCG